MEVESPKTKQALTESQTRNQHLQEQVAMQRQVLKEMEQQLQSSHQLTTQLRAQVRRPPGCVCVGGCTWLWGAFRSRPQTQALVPLLPADRVNKGQFCRSLFPHL